MSYGGANGLNEFWNGADYPGYTSDYLKDFVANGVGQISPNGARYFSDRKVERLR